jgi:hypothetical protein
MPQRGRWRDRAAGRRARWPTAAGRCPTAAGRRCRSRPHQRRGTHEHQGFQARAPEERIARSRPEVAGTSTRLRSAFSRDDCMRSRCRGWTQSTGGPHDCRPSAAVAVCGRSLGGSPPCLPVTGLDPARQHAIWLGAQGERLKPRRGSARNGLRRLPIASAGTGVHEHAERAELAGQAGLTRTSDGSR